MYADKNYFMILEAYMGLFYFVENTDEILIGKMYSD